MMNSSNFGLTNYVTNIPTIAGIPGDMLADSNRERYLIQQSDPFLQAALNAGDTRVSHLQQNAEARLLNQTTQTPVQISISNTVSADTLNSENTAQTVRPTAESLKPDSPSTDSALLSNRPKGKGKGKAYAKGHGKGKGHAKGKAK